MDDANERSLLDSDEHPMNPETRNASTFLKANAAKLFIMIIVRNTCGSSRMTPIWVTVRCQISGQLSLAYLSYLLAS